MTRRKTVNETGISRIEIEGSFHDAYAMYSCVNCGHINLVNVGQKLLNPIEALNTQKWECGKCGFIHSKNSDLPDSWSNWAPELLECSELTVERFWTAFFRSATENQEAYWKKCNVCGRVLPNANFSKHVGWGPLEKQMECRACKGAINAVLNCKRTVEQLRESGIRRRIADMFVEDHNEKINIDELFKRFDSKCFKTGKQLDKIKKGSWHIDHILPSKYLYPLTVRNACLLSNEANSNKRDKWPSEFYTTQELVELAKITGADLSLISNNIPIINNNIDVNRGVERYLTIRNKVDLSKRVAEIRKVIHDYNLENLLSDNNKKILGITTE